MSACSFLERFKSTLEDGAGAAFFRATPPCIISQNEVCTKIYGIFPFKVAKPDRLRDSYVVISGWYAEFPRAQEWPVLPNGELG